MVTKSTGTFEYQVVGFNMSLERGNLASVAGRLEKLSHASSALNIPQ